MPEVSFQLEWPDGKSSTLYSPSTVILDYFRPGDSLLVSELEERGVEALRAASVFLNDKQRSAVSSFLQAPFTGNYNAQSGEIVGVLKNMNDTSIQFNVRQ